ncbi:MAG: hypothetical protein NLN56_05575 [Nitrosopumilus sp.]|nr:hypothetical protein [Nitrosopumilus sp.]
MILVVTNSKWELQRKFVSHSKNERNYSNDVCWDVLQMDDANMTIIHNMIKLVN